VRTAPAAERSDATTALAPALFLFDLSPDDRAARPRARSSCSVDDPSPLVRAALARLAFQMWLGAAAG